MSWLEGSPKELIVGAIKTFDIVYVGAETITSPSAILYKNGGDYSGTAMPSGSISVLDNVITLKPIVATAGDGGHNFVVSVTATVDGQTDVRKFMIIVLRETDEQT